MQQGLREGFREMMNPGGPGNAGTMQSSTLVGSGNGYDETEARMRELNAPFWVKLRKLFTGSLNFYRVHMLYFIIVSGRGAPLLPVLTPRRHRSSSLASSTAPTRNTT